LFSNRGRLGKRDSDRSMRQKGVCVGLPGETGEGENLNKEGKEKRAESHRLNRDGFIIRKKEMSRGRSGLNQGGRKPSIQRQIIETILWKEDRLTRKAYNLFEGEGQEKKENSACGGSVD